MRYVLLLIAIPLLAQQQQPALRGLSLEKEAALGRTLADDFRRRTPSVEDAALRGYLTKVVARLNEVAKSPFPLVIEISSGTDSTVGLPGGYLFVPLKLLADAQEEAELARSIAHAIAHIASRPATQTPAANAGAIPLIFMGGWHDDSVMVPQGFRKAREEQEVQALRLADEWVNQAGFAGGALQTGDFEAMRDRARELTPAPRSVEPPSLRRRRQ